MHVQLAQDSSGVHDMCNFLYTGVLINLGCQLGWIWTQLTDIPLSRPVRVFPGRSH